MVHHAPRGLAGFFSRENQYFPDPPEGASFRAPPRKKQLTKHENNYIGTA